MGFDRLCHYLPPREYGVDAVDVAARVARLPPPGELFGWELSTAQQSLLLRGDIVIFIVQDGVIAYNALRRLSRGRTLNIARPCSGWTQSCQWQQQCKVMFQTHQSSCEADWRSGGKKSPPGGATNGSRFLWPYDPDEVAVTATQRAHTMSHRLRFTNAAGFGS